MPSWPWNILVVDDDEDVLAVTRLGLKGLKAMDRSINLVCAYSAAEAKVAYQSHDSIALLITDVVMESDDAGLELVRWLRTQDKGQQTRVVVRTGQPGFAPEELVLRQYDINDYWPKAQTDIHRIRSQIVGLIRSFKDIQALQWQSTHLSKLVSSMNTLIGLRNQARVLEHVSREMEWLGVSWACFVHSEESAHPPKCIFHSQSCDHLQLMVRQT